MLKQSLGDNIVTTDFKGPGHFRLEFRAGSGRLGLPCWLAIPAGFDPGSAPLVAVHGIRRNAKLQAELFGKVAAASGQAVIAPLFAEEPWCLYQQVVRKGRADLALLGLMNELRLSGIWNTEKFYLSGFSGGAQFAHRFAMLYPHLIAGLSVASAGWYTFPDNAPFPYGLGLRPERKDDWGQRMESRLNEFLHIPMKISVGALDGKRDANTRSGSEIDQQQGTNRIERAHRWKKAVIQAAHDRNLPAPDVEFKLLPDSGHDFGECVKNGGLAKFVLSNFKPDKPEHGDLLRKLRADSEIVYPGNALNNQV